MARMKIPQEVMNLIGLDKSKIDKEIESLACYLMERELNIIQTMVILEIFDRKLEETFKSKASDLMSMLEGKNSWDGFKVK